VDSLLAFRPASVVRHLSRGSQACPLSLRDLLASVGRGAPPLPLVRAPEPGVARAALVAAKELRSVVGLALPPGAAPEPWFEAVTRAADEWAPRHPIFLTGEVILAGGSELELERAQREGWRLVDAGATHLAIDLQAVPEEARAQALLRTAEAALEREIGVDVVVPMDGTLPSAPRAAALLEKLEDLGLRPDLASARFPLPAGEEDERTQRRVLLDLCGWIDGTPLLRRGPVSRAVLASLRNLPVGACDDGGVALAAATLAAGLPPEPGAPPPLARQGRAPAPPLELGDLPEALAYVEVAAFLEALGAPGSAPAVAQGLLSRAEYR
jgi:hypothetical protein